MIKTANKTFQATGNYLGGFFEVVGPAAEIRRSPLRFAPGGMRQLSGELLILPSAPLRGEPGVRDGCPSGAPLNCRIGMIMKKIMTMPVLLVLGCLIAGIYGCLHDQISYTVSPEYYTRFKFHQFCVPETLHNRLGAAVVG
jgi:hypothetical protein